MYVCVCEKIINLRNSKKNIGVVGEGRDKNSNNNNTWNNKYEILIF